jgi:hypothetical protein
MGKTIKSMAFTLNASTLKFLASNSRPHPQLKLNLVYMYDAAGNINAQGDRTRNKAFTYKHDALDRLTSVSGNLAELYSYNAVGNLTRKGIVLTCA